MMTILIILTIRAAIWMILTIIMFDNENDANRDNNYANNRDHNKHDNTKTIMTIHFIIKEIQSVYVSFEWETNLDTTCTSDSRSGIFAWSSLNREQPPGGFDCIVNRPKYTVVPGNIWIDAGWFPAFRKNWDNNHSTTTTFVSHIFTHIEALLISRFLINLFQK